MNNGPKGNAIGSNNNCVFFVDKGATLTIGENVGISQTALVCHKNISIGNNVKIGGGVKIYDQIFTLLIPKYEPVTKILNIEKRPQLLSMTMLLLELFRSY